VENRQKRVNRMNLQVHVYIIEDDITMIGLLKTLLTMEGFRVTTYPQHSSMSMMDLLATDLPDVLILDVNLRDLDGMEILQQVKADARLKSVRILMSSGSDYKDICLKYGADDFLLKPYMPDDLIKIIRGLSASPL
jgi:DNA-binding response OmpR family regulator